MPVPPSRPVRATILVVLFALVVAAGCSGDEGGSAEGGSDRETTTTTSPPPPTTTTTIAEAVFDGEVARANAALDTAGTDRCQLVTLTTTLSSLPAPTTARQVEAAVGVVTRYLRAMADAAGADEREAAEGMRRAADALEAEAAEVGYDPAVVNSAESLDTFRSEDYRESITALGQAAEAACGTSPTSTP